MPDNRNMGIVRVNKQYSFIFRGIFLSQIKKGRQLCKEVNRWHWTIISLRYI